MRAKTPERTPFGLPSKGATLVTDRRRNISLGGQGEGELAPTPRLVVSTVKMSEESHFSDPADGGPPEGLRPREPSLSHCLESVLLYPPTSHHPTEQQSKTHSSSHPFKERKERRRSFAANRLFSVALSQATCGAGAERNGETDCITLAIPFPTGDNSRWLAEPKIHHGNVLLDSPADVSTVSDQI